MAVFTTSLINCQIFIFFPFSFHRCLTLSFICRIPPGITSHQLRVSTRSHCCSILCYSLVHIFDNSFPHSILRFLIFTLSQGVPFPLLSLGNLLSVDNQILCDDHNYVYKAHFSVCPGFFHTGCILVFLQSTQYFPTFSAVERDLLLAVIFL